MKKKWLEMLLAGIMAVSTLAGCGAKEESKIRLDRSADLCV